MPAKRTTPVRCDHRGPTTVELVEGGCAARCLVCGTVGPVRDTPEAASKALLVLGVRDGEPRHQGPTRFRGQ
jgi:hypothetical protein